MYKRNVQGWAKNIGFMLLDMICLQVVFIAAVFIHLLSGRLSYLDF